MVKRRPPPCLLFGNARRYDLRTIDRASDGGGRSPRTIHENCIRIGFLLVHENDFHPLDSHPLNEAPTIRSSLLFGLNGRARRSLNFRLWDEGQINEVNPPSVEGQCG